MHRIAGNKKGQHVPHTRVVRHVIETADLQPTLALGGHIEAEICEKVATRDHVPGGPGETDAVGWCGTEPRDDDVLRVHARDNSVLDSGATHDRSEERVLGHVLLLLDRGGLQQTRDHGGKHLDMADLLGADVQDHVLVLLRAATVPPLEEVVHHHADLAPLAAERLLQHLGEQRVRPLGPRVILQLLAVEEHRGLPGRRTARCDAAWHRASGPSERRELAVGCAATQRFSRWSDLVTRRSRALIYLSACRGRTRKASAVKHAALAACTIRCQVRPTTETSNTRSQIGMITVAPRTMLSARRQDHKARAEM